MTRARPDEARPDAERAASLSSRRLAAVNPVERCQEVHYCLPMADESLLARIEELVKEEHSLQQREQDDAKDLDALELDRSRLEQVSIELDQCWDLLRQRRARRDAGQDPGDAQVRDADTVERYWQ